MRRGQATLELLVVIPFVALLLFGVIEMGAAWRTHHTVAHTAREGARLAILPGAVEAEVRAEMVGILAEGGVDPSSTSILFPCEGDCFGAARAQGIPGRGSGFLPIRLRAPGAHRRFSLGRRERVWPRLDPDRNRDEG